MVYFFYPLSHLIFFHDSKMRTWHRKPVAASFNKWLQRRKLTVCWGRPESALSLLLTSKWLRELPSGWTTTSTTWYHLPRRWWGAAGKLFCTRSLNTTWSTSTASILPRLFDTARLCPTRWAQQHRYWIYSLSACKIVIYLICKLFYRFPSRKKMTWTRIRLKLCRW